MSSTNSNPPGVTYPTKQGMLAGNPQNSAIQQSQNISNKAASLNKAVGGSKKRQRRRRNRGGGVAVPQYTNMPYTSTNGPNEHPNAQIAGNTQTSVQGAANAALDSGAMIKGGSRKRFKNKKNSRKNKRRTHKRNRSSRSHKFNKTNKSGGRMANSDWKWGCYS